MTRAMASLTDYRRREKQMMISAKGSNVSTIVRIKIFSGKIWNGSFHFCLEKNHQEDPCWVFWLHVVVTLEQASSRTTDCQLKWHGCRGATLRLIKAEAATSGHLEYMTRLLDLWHTFIYNPNLDVKARHGLSDLQRDEAYLIWSEILAPLV